MSQYLRNLTGLALGLLFVALVAASMG